MGATVAVHQHRAELRKDGPFHTIHCVRADNEFVTYPFQF